MKFHYKHTSDKRYVSDEIRIDKGSVRIILRIDLSHKNGYVTKIAQKNNGIGLFDAFINKDSTTPFEVACGVIDIYGITRFDLPFNVNKKTSYTPFIKYIVETYELINRLYTDSRFIEIIRKLCINHLLDEMKDNKKQRRSLCKNLFYWGYYQNKGSKKK